MKPQTLRELILVYSTEMSTACNKPATIGQLLAFAKMIEMEIKNVTPNHT